jgi:DNA repair protein RadC
MSKIRPSRMMTTVQGQQYQLDFYVPPATVAAKPEVTTAKPSVAAEKLPTIRELPLSESPAARLESYGAGALSILELLALTAGLPTFTDAQNLLNSAGSLQGLAALPWSQLIALKGISTKRAAQIKAAFELGRRLLVASPVDRPVVKSPADGANLIMGEMQVLEQEHLVTIILDTKNHVLKIHTVYIGSLNSAQVRVGELFKEAIRCNAAAVIVAHNHPSGDPAPSPEDVSVTRQIVEAGKLLNVDVLDHLVIGQGRWVSLKERGLGF